MLYSQHDERKRGVMEQQWRDFSKAFEEWASVTDRLADRVRSLEAEREVVQASAMSALTNLGRGDDPEGVLATLLAGLLSGSEAHV